MQTIDIYAAHAEHSRLWDIIEDMDARLGGAYDPVLDDLLRDAAELRCCSVTRDREASMTRVTRIRIIAIAHHRNGIGGAPFHVALFKDAGPAGSRKAAILFPEEGRCAVLDIARLAAGDIAFGSNSSRGDQYEPRLRKAVNAFHISRLIQEGHL